MTKDLRSCRSYPGGGPMGFDFAMGRFPCCLVKRSPADKILVLIFFFEISGLHFGAPLWEFAWRSN